MTPESVAHHAIPSMEISKKEYWSALQFPYPGDLLDPGIEHQSPASPALVGGFFTTAPPGKPIFTLALMNNVKIKSKSHSVMSYSL